MSKKTKQQESMKLFSVEFDGVYPVGSCLVLLAYTLEQATSIARETIDHTDVFTVTEVEMDKPKVVVYRSGDY